MKVFAIHSEKRGGYWSEIFENWTEHLDFATYFSNHETLSRSLTDINEPDAEWNNIATPPAIPALLSFVATVDATGGLVPADCDGADKGLLAPAGDPEWTDLATAYEEACKVLNRKPLIEMEETEPSQA